VSVHVSAAVWSNETLGGSSKLVLLKLADCADDDGRNAFPSVARVARECGLGERTVQRILATLVTGGYLVIDQPATRHRPTVYRVIPDPRGASMTPLRGATNVSQMAPDPSGPDLLVGPDPDLNDQRSDRIGSGAKSTRKRRPSSRNHGALERVIRRS